MSHDRAAFPATTAVRIGEAARRMGLDASVLYETVIELADEGMLTARCINAAAGILLTQLGLPGYFFRHISKDALRRVLQVLATNMTAAKGRFFLSNETAHLECNVDGGLQVLVATAETRDYMESMIGEALANRRWEYYFSSGHNYYTYIIKQEQSGEASELADAQSRFAFGQDESNLFVPEETRGRYEDFLDSHLASVARLVEFTRSVTTGETRLMFHKRMASSSLPIVRKLLADRGLRLNRAYGETYRTPQNTTACVCSLYVEGPLDDILSQFVAADLRSFLALGQNPFADMYLDGTLSFPEMLFAVNAGFFVHQFVYKVFETDRQIMECLKRKDLRDALSKRISDANHSEYLREIVSKTIRANPELLKQLFQFFDLKFNPERPGMADPEALAQDLGRFAKRLDSIFIDDSTPADIFRFACRLIRNVRKTNFYKADKRSFAFRLDPGVLDPIVFSEMVFGIFFVVGHYALGTHMRAEDVARGGLRLLRITPGNYENELDDANLLNYALGPKAQRLKHKDIAESGSKGVIVPTPDHAGDGLNAVCDCSEGILDLILPSDEVKDYLGQPEMIFFGPDEGTAHFMDAIAVRAGERGYPHWRTFTTGKEIGMPHDAYGLTQDGQVFALLGRGEQGTELQIDGASVATTLFPNEIHSHIGERVASSGMTTTGVMAAFRALIARRGRREEDLNLMMTGGPDGDLGANQIQTYRGKICLVIDGGAVLFDPEGLDARELKLLAFSRHRSPRPNSAAYPREKLSPAGFLVERSAKNVTLPDGAVVEDGAFFHKTFLTTPENRRFVEQAGIRAFVPCGGAKDTVNFANVCGFLAVFPELEFIVEGANVFFDDAAREAIATQTDVLQIKDSTANKGGVTCSSLGEVLSAFLLQEDYEQHVVHDAKTRFELARELLGIIAANAETETNMLLDLHANEGPSLAHLSIRTSEQLLALQERLYQHLDLILANEDLVAGVVEAYVPSVLTRIVGVPRILEILGDERLLAYRNALLTKKLASLALYRHAVEWDDFLRRLDGELEPTLVSLLPKA